MKSYKESIIWLAEQSFDKLRYYTWPAVMTIAHTYEVSQTQVVDDFEAEVARINQQRKEEYRAKNRADHEARRLANLQRKNAQ